MSCQPITRQHYTRVFASRTAKKFSLHSHAKRGNDETDIHQFLTSYLTSELLIPAEQIQPAKPLADYGIHSIAAVQLLKRRQWFYWRRNTWTGIIRAPHAKRVSRLYRRLAAHL
ncbi:acyl carrier protein [Methylocucumis oryzae]|uniref:acyl carrier protein n=1 Tax=Methylocucumis oryzae TaxID=1632867 RepID=UPI000D6DEDC7